MWDASGADTAALISGTFPPGPHGCMTPSAAAQACRVPVCRAGRECAGPKGGWDHLLQGAAVWGTGWDCATVEASGGQVQGVDRTGTAPPSPAGQHGPDLYFERGGLASGLSGSLLSCADDPSLAGGRLWDLRRLERVRRGPWVGRAGRWPGKQPGDIQMLVTQGAGSRSAAPH